MKTGKNKYARRARISEARFRTLVRLFSLDLTADNIAYLARLNRNTVNRYLTLIRERIAEYCEEQSPILSSMDGAWLEGMEQPMPTPPIFGVLQRGGRIYTELVPEPLTEAVRTMLKQGKGADFSILAMSGYDGVVDMRGKKPYHAQSAPDAPTAQSRARQSLPGSFWSFARGRLQKFHGVPRSAFYLHLKECEFRFNLGRRDLYPVLLKIIRENPLN